MSKLESRDLLVVLICLHPYPQTKFSINIISWNFESFSLVYERVILKTNTYYKIRNNRISHSLGFIDVVSLYGDRKISVRRLLLVSVLLRGSEDPKTRGGVTKIEQFSCSRLRSHTTRTESSPLDLVTNSYIFPLLLS